jgi:hypothetical protein
VWVSSESRAKVDEMVGKGGVPAAGTTYNEPRDRGFLCKDMGFRTLTLLLRLFLIGTGVAFALCEVDRRRLGYPESVILGLGIVLLACTDLYAIPRTAGSARSC